MHWHVVSAIWKRNLVSYFSGVIGYLFIMAFVGVGAFAAFAETFFANNLANLDQLNQWFPWLLIVIVPAITMGAWADERKQGTDELLFTLPASDWEIVLGKYLAVLTVYTVALLFSTSHLIVLHALGSPDLGLMLANYLGYWVLGAALLSCGMVASAMTSSATVAYVLGILLSAVPVGVRQFSTANPMFDSLSVWPSFTDFGSGLVPLGGFLYFASIVVTMLYLNRVLLSRRHWWGGPHAANMGFHYFVRTIALGVALIGGNVIASNFTSRVDLTSEGLYSLSSATEKVVTEMKAERPVLIQAFVSPQVPREYVPIKSTLVGLLRQLDQLGGDKVRVRIVETEKFSDQAEEAKRYGIMPVETQSERGGRFVVDEVFLGAVFTSGADEEVVLPFINVGTPIEYELMRSLRTVSLAKRRTLGILRGDAKVTGGFDMQSFRSTPEWRIVTELKKQYEVKEVGPDELGKEPLDALLALMPSSLTEPEMQKFVAYVEGGAATLIVDDPFVMVNPSLSPRQPKPRAGGNPMFGGGPPPEAKADNGEARALTNLLEIAWNSGSSVWDFYDPHPELSQLLQRFNIVYVGENSGGSRPFNPDNEITKGLQEVMLLYPGEIRPRKDSALTFTPLLRTSPKSAVVEWDEYTTSAGFMGGIAPKSPEQISIPSPPIEYVLAAKISGAKKSVSAALSGAEDVKKGKELNVIYVADLDMISDTFFQIRDQKWQGLNLDNVTFILNCVDDLVGDDTFIDLRKRRPQHRTLETIEQETTRFKVAFTEESKKASIEAAEKLKKAEKSLAEEVKKIRDDASMDERTKAIRLRAAEENERRRLDVDKAEIENERSKKIKEQDAVKERNVRRIESWWRWMACVISPIPALIVGIFVFASRVQTERQGIAADRQVKRR